MHADVIVIGAGPAGCAAAIPLARAGYEVLILERKAAEDGEDSTSGEVLAPQTQFECAQLGIELAGAWILDRFHRVRNVYPDLSWTCHELPREMSYVHVDRGGFNAALRAAVTAAGGHLLWNARVSDVETHTDTALVRTVNGAEYRAPLLIDAAGRYSPTLRCLGLKSEDPEFSQIGVALFFSSFADTPANLWDRHFYGQHGKMISGSRIRPGLYRYILEADLADKQATRMKPVELFEHVAKQHDPWLYERIQREPRVGSVWAMAPLAYRVSEVARDRLLLAGDATGYLAPLTGQGIEFAMRMGRLAAQAGATALARNDFSAATFSGYVQERKDETDTAIGFLRHQLRCVRDRDLLLRAARDVMARVEAFGPLAAVATEHGSLL